MARISNSRARAGRPVRRKTVATARRASAVVSRSSQTCAAWSAVGEGPGNWVVVKLDGKVSRNDVCVGEQCVGRNPLVAGCTVTRDSGGHDYPGKHGRQALIAGSLKRGTSLSSNGAE